MAATETEQMIASHCVSGPPDKPKRRGIAQRALPSRL
jgi:hypothetical protein